MESIDNKQNLGGLDYLKLLFNSEGDHLYQKFTDLFPAIVYIFDAETRKLRFINKQITDILGYTYEDVLAWDNDLMKAVFQDDIEIVTKELEKFYALKDDDFHSYNSRLIPKAGDFKYFKTLGTILRRKENGNPDSILFIAQDITDQLSSS